MAFFVISIALFMSSAHGYPNGLTDGMKLTPGVQLQPGMKPPDGFSDGVVILDGMKLPNRTKIPNGTIMNPFKASSMCDFCKRVLGWGVNTKNCMCKVLESSIESEGINQFIFQLFCRKNKLGCNDPLAEKNKVTVTGTTLPLSVLGPQSVWYVLLLVSLVMDSFLLSTRGWKVKRRNTRC